jgi:hypothetical protein
MSQQISMQDAFPTFQKRCTELFEANLLLQAQVDVQERQIAALQEENARLKDTAGSPAPGLGAAPAEQAPYSDHANLDQQDDLERSHG